MMRTTGEIRPHLSALRRLLDSASPGPVDCARELATAWDELDGDDGGMQPYKLLGRCEGMEWHPPILSFDIERHGGTVLGSIYAEVQSWDIDVEAGTAKLFQGTRKRRLYKAQPKFDHAQVAAELADLIVQGREDERLRWSGDRVQIRFASVLPNFELTSNQTNEGRRKRLNQSLGIHLGAHGWTRGANGWWSKADQSEREG